MPDLINPAYNGGKKELRLWVDELCKSCRVQDECPLLHILREHTILTMFGMHVCNCELYDPDVESEYYLKAEPSVEDVAQINQKALEQRLEDLRAKMEKLNEAFTAR